ncbi:DUF4395 domain-containing protein [Caldinitratiruptor microaerophilus]|uniref:DUF4395 domain-containing protein n=1 Tax=Caldinitratiruptor microaerophilus TaxID=671077 RepID=A0AA35CLI7_9FIRM|nr:DUF4395 domain-containing protein [Caldinitratiruptor microaerophilus]BDG61427.1 hypothetical protein caldi_25170 [Caldinitratiruptor microaerophilus]
MREVPLPLVRFSQAAMVVFILIGILLRQPLFTSAVLVILLLGLAFGPQANLFFRVARPLLVRRLAGAPTEAAELLRFNQSIAAGLLALAQLAFFALGSPVAGWVLSLAVALAAGLALTGHCVGCFLYYQLRMLRHRRTTQA